jgi:hypothetical protein
VAKRRTIFTGGLKEHNVSESRSFAFQVIDNIGISMRAAEETKQGGVARNPYIVKEQMQEFDSGVVDLIGKEVRLHIEGLRQNPVTREVTAFERTSRFHFKDIQAFQNEYLYQLRKYIAELKEDHAAKGGRNPTPDPLYTTKIWIEPVHTQTYHRDARGRFTSAPGGTFSTKKSGRGATPTSTAKRSGGSSPAPDGPSSSPGKPRRSSPKKGRK